MNMFSIFGLLMLFVPTIFAVSCPIGHLDYCTDAARGFWCSSYYEFTFDQSTASYTSVPAKCIDPGSGSTCVRGSTTCTPPCDLRKQFGNTDYTCSTFNSDVESCANYWTGPGKTWCFWSSTAYCYSGIQCHHP